MKKKTSFLEEEITKLYLDLSGNPVTEKVTVTVPTTLPPVTVVVTDASGNPVTGYQFT